MPAAFSPSASHQVSRTAHRVQNGVVCDRHSYIVTHCGDFTRMVEIIEHKRVDDSAAMVHLKRPIPAFSGWLAGL